MNGPADTGRGRPLGGIAWAILAVLTGSILLALPKWAGTDMSPVQITLLRYITGFLTIAPFFAYMQLGPESGRPPTGERNTILLHALRAFMAVARISCFFYAITHMPFANAQAITLTNGVFMMVSAVILLGERLKPVTIGAAAVCFAGAIIVAEPDLNDGRFLSLGALAALAGAAIWGLESTVIKYTAVRDNAVRILFTVNLIALLLVTVPGYLVWTPLREGEWLPLLLIGPLAILTQLFNVKAFRVTDANILAPFRYTSVVFALLIGWFVFGEWPSLWGGVGIVLILISGTVLTINIGGYPRRVA